MTISEVTILGDHDPTLAIRHLGDAYIGRTVAVLQCGRVHRVVFGVSEEPGKPAGS